MNQSPATSNGLRAIEHAASTYWLPSDNVVDEVLNPALAASEQVELMSGFFSGAVLSEIAHGLAAYLVNTDSPLLMLVSPVISTQDQEMVLEGINLASLGTTEIEKAFQDQLSLESALALHTKRCLAYLLANGRLQMRVVLMKEGIFHPKQWTFIHGSDVATLSGSANATLRGFKTNVEQLRLDRSWASRESADACEQGHEQFRSFWDNERPDLGVSIEVGEAALSGLLKPYATDQPPSEEEYLKARAIDAKACITEPEIIGFHVPPHVLWDSGPFKHQGEAVRAWEDNDRRGILSIATGGGKTISSLVAAERLAQKVPKLLVVVSAPTRPLVAQWKDEMEMFGLNPYSSTDGGSAKDHLREVERRIIRLESKVSAVESIVLTNNALISPPMRELLDSSPEIVLLIADEVHNLGTSSFINEPPGVKFRLGLSATPERQYDESGTAGLLRYFGDVVYEFSLQDAISAGCLVPYRYFLQAAPLTDAEHENYQELTDKIRRISAYTGGKSDEPSANLQRLLEKRRLVLESAQAKVPLLEKQLRKIGPKNVELTLIYCTDKNPKQLIQVNELLASLGITYHQITAQETGDAKLVKSVLEAFSNGDIQVLTAKRVLDEGFNVPEVSTAFVLASTTVRRQWVQRRGRILRTCTEIGKTSADLHDFVVLPPTSITPDRDAAQLVRRELERCREFAEASTNQHLSDGSAILIDEIEHEFLVWTNGEN